jgi:hypothetical protein
MQTMVRTRNDSLPEWAVVIGTGIFATGLAQPELLALPIRRLLTEVIFADITDDVRKTYLMAVFLASYHCPGR